MLSPRPIGREPVGVLPPPPANEDRVAELEKRLIRLENDRRWLGILLIVVAVAGVIGPLSFLWISYRRADRVQEDVAVLDERVADLDRDVAELLSALLEERPDDERVAAREPLPSRAPPPPRDAADPPREVVTARAAEPTTSRPAALELARSFGGRVLYGPLDAREQASLQAQWRNLDPALQQQTLTVIFRRYGIDPETFFAAIGETDEGRAEPP